MGAAAEDFGGAEVAEDVPLGPLTTFRVGPIARRVITAGTADQVVAALRAADRDDVVGGSVLVLGGGSNVLIADDLVGLTVVLLANRGVEIDSQVVDGQQSVILPQVTFGIAVRMAVMSIVAGNEA